MNGFPRAPPSSATACALPKLVPSFVRGLHDPRLRVGEVDLVLGFGDRIDGGRRQGCLGPVLGGYISDNSTWRWIFYINVPIGIVSLVLTHFIVRDPPGTEEQVKANWRSRLKFDYIGLALVLLGLGSLEVVMLYLN